MQTEDLTFYVNDLVAAIHWYTTELGHRPQWISACEACFVLEGIKLKLSQQRVDPVRSTRRPSRDLYQTQVRSSRYAMAVTG